MVYVVVIVTFFFLWILMLAILFTLTRKDKPTDKLKYFDEDYLQREKHEASPKKKISMIRFLSQLVPHSKLGQKRRKRFEEELLKADSRLTVDEWLVIRLVSATVTALLSFAAFEDYFVLLMTFVLVWNIPRLIISSKKKERIKLFDSQLNEGTMIISNALKSGYSFLQASAAVAEETKDPFAKEFKKLIKEMGLGISEENALKNLLVRVDSEDLRLVINAILIQKDIGGNLSEILDNIAETIRERQKLKNELKTLTAQGRLSGVIVTLLPVVLGAVIYLFNKEYIMLLLTTPLGLGMLAGCVISEFFGFLMIRKIVTIDM